MKIHDKLFKYNWLTIASLNYEGCYESNSLQLTAVLSTVHQGEMN